MADIKESALKAVVNRPSLLVMVVGSLQLLGVLYAGVQHPATATWLLMFNAGAGLVVLLIGTAMMFYGTKKDAEAKEAADKRRAHHAPRVKRTQKQRDTCLQFHTALPWAMAIRMPCPADAALLADPEAMLVALTACRINLGSTQGLLALTSDAGRIIVESVIPTDETIMAAPIDG